MKFLRSLQTFWLKITTKLRRNKSKFQTEDDLEDALPSEGSALKKSLKEIGSKVDENHKMRSGEKNTRKPFSNRFVIRGLPPYKSKPRTDRRPKGLEILRGGNPTFKATSPEVLSHGHQDEYKPIPKSSTPLQELLRRPGFSIGYAIPDNIDRDKLLYKWDGKGNLMVTAPFIEEKK